MNNRINSINGITNKTKKNVNNNRVKINQGIDCAFLQTEHAKMNHKFKKKNVSVLKYTSSASIYGFFSCIFECKTYRKFWMQFFSIYSISIFFFFSKPWYHFQIFRHAKSIFNSYCFVACIIQFSHCVCWFWATIVINSLQKPKKKQYTIQNHTNLYNIHVKRGASVVWRVNFYIIRINNT